ncbi:MAG TPA: DUF2946 family protein [Stellaceae bacterium]|jgi:hypothetical protein|nr:DUF2946 family protein [Stellaceae bacterium]
MLALLLNALVPIHLSFELVDALNARHAHRGHAAVDPSHELLAKLVGHEERPDRHSGDHHHRTDCAVCSSVSALAGFAAPSPAMLPAPNTVAQPVVLAIGHAAFPGASPAPYRSRAPPRG